MLFPDIPNLLSKNSCSRYVHGPRGIQAVEDSTGSWQSPVQDGLGSVRDNALSYSPFGVPDAAAEGFAFTGEMRDSNGLQFHRARYYSPELGVWPSLDLVEDGNRYAYVEGNPVTKSDPTGLTPIDGGNPSSVGFRLALHFRRRPHFQGYPVYGAPSTDWGFGPNNYTYKVKDDGLDNPYRRLGGLHNGLDFGVPYGTYLRAVDYGVVMYAGPSIWGAPDYNVIVRYGNVLALYGHVQNPDNWPGASKAGEFVSPGDGLGLSGSFNYDHLHFEVRSIREDIINQLELDARAVSVQNDLSCPELNEDQVAQAAITNDFIIALKMNELFMDRNLNSVQERAEFYLNPLEYFTGIPLGAWKGTYPDPDIDSDDNGYPDRVALAGEASPVSYNEYSLSSISASSNGLFWDNSRLVE